MIAHLIVCAVAAFMLAVIGRPDVGLVCGLAAALVGILLWSIDGIMRGDADDARRRNRWP